MFLTPLSGFNLDFLGKLNQHFHISNHHIMPKMTVQELENQIIFWSSYCREDKVYEVLTEFVMQNQ